ncbi:MAG: hypothetical protein ACQEVT_18965, partial [Pseudomonadota bacterium]
MNIATEDDMPADPIMPADNPLFAFFVISFVVSGAAGLIHGEVWKRTNPDKLDFKWVYFTLYNALIHNI